MRKRARLGFEKAMGEAPASTRRVRTVWAALAATSIGTVTVVPSGATVSGPRVRPSGGTAWTAVTPERPVPERVRLTLVPMMPTAGVRPVTAGGATTPSAVEKALKLRDCGVG